MNMLGSTKEPGEGRPANRLLFLPINNLPTFTHTNTHPLFAFFCLLGKGV